MTDRQDRLSEALTHLERVVNTATIGGAEGRQASAEAVLEVGAWLSWHPLHVAAFLEVLQTFVAAGETIVGERVDPGDDGVGPLPGEYTDAALVLVRDSHSR